MVKLFRIIVDVVFNHMTGIGMKQGSDGVSSSSGSYFDSTPDVQNYPAAGYDKIHFNNRRCNRSIKEYEYRTSVESVDADSLKTTDKFPASDLTILNHMPHSI